MKTMSYFLLLWSRKMRKKSSVCNKAVRVGKLLNHVLLNNNNNNMNENTFQKIFKECGKIISDCPFLYCDYSDVKCDI